MTAVRGAERTGASAGRTGVATGWDLEEDQWSRRVTDSEEAGNVRLAKALGWFSVALGVAELAAPRGLSRLIGVADDEDNRRLMQAMGLRELVTGVAILSRPERPGGMWARVGGDAVDLALLGSAYRSERNEPRRVAAATAAVLGVTALDVLAGRRLAGGNGVAAAEDRGVRVRRSVTVNRSPEEAYRFWRDFGNLPRFMRHLESVEVLEGGRSRWRATAPAGRTVEWEAELVEDRPNEVIAWRSLPGADVDNAGVVRFVPAPGGRGTEVRVELEYRPPGGKVGQLAAKLFGEEPAQQVSGDLRRFKQVLETGEVVQSDASVHGEPHPAQPTAPGQA